MSKKLSFITMLACLFMVIYTLPLGFLFAFGKCTEGQIKRMETAGFSKEEIATLCDTSIEQADLAQKEKAKEGESTNTGLTAMQNRWGPIVKGLQLGMPYNEAITALKRRSSNNIHINPRINSGGNVDIFLEDKTGKDYLSHLINPDDELIRTVISRFSLDASGSLSINDSGIITKIYFHTRLVNALFNAYDVKTSDFVKALAKHYGIKEWQQKIKRTRTKIDNSILTEEVWTFQGDDFTIEVSRAIGITDHIDARDKSLSLTIEAPETTEPSSDRIIFE